MGRRRKSPGGHVAAVEEVADADSPLDVPAQGRQSAIAHGDFRFGNCLTDPVTGRISAVLDWGALHPRGPARRRRLPRRVLDRPRIRREDANDPSGGNGFPSYADLLERYARRTGRDLAGIDYYVVFQSWRLAVIGEGVYARFLHGAMASADDVGAEELAAMKVGTEQLAAAALDAVLRLR